MIGFLAAGVALAATGLAYFILSGGPVSNEWDCSRGEYPTTGSVNECLPYGRHVPAGATAHPNGPIR